MRWRTGQNHSTKIPPRASLVKFPNPAVEPEVTIDFRGLSVWLSLREAQQLAADLNAVVSQVDRSASTKTKE